MSGRCGDEREAGDDSSASMVLGPDERRRAGVLWAARGVVRDSVLLRA
jgi:hypothetical protein